MQLVLSPFVRKHNVIVIDKLYPANKPRQQVMQTRQGEEPMSDDVYTAPIYQRFKKW